MKTFILLVLLHVHSGAVLQTQEFNSLEHCKHAAKVLQDYSDVYFAECVDK